MLLGDDLLNFKRQTPVLHPKDRMRDNVQLNGEDGEHNPEFHVLFGPAYGERQQEKIV